MSEQELLFYCGSHSSPGETHEVSAQWTEEELILFCSCPAGQRGIPCRHLLGVIANDSTILLEPNNADQLQDLALLQTWLADTTCLADLNRLAEMERIVKEHKKFKAHITDMLQGGWKRTSWLNHNT